MRYQTWDVLLFPEGSKVPLQEFKTQCLVTRDTENLQHSTFTSVAYTTDGKSLTLAPVVTAFVGSLTPGDTFRVSIHSWERPKPSRALEILKQIEDTTVFEARVYIDGALRSRNFFDNCTVWPFVVDCTSYSDREGDADTLRFPPFHHEILKQNHWDAGEALGRIKIVLAEGLSRDLRSTPAGSTNFERFKDVVAFSFQHAPLHILEFSGIAWPNETMWKQAQKLIGQPDLYSQNLPVKPDHDAHAHSPRRSNLTDQRRVQMTCYNDLRECAELNCQHPKHLSQQQTMQARQLPTYPNNWMPPTAGYSSIPRNQLHVDDPFMGPYPGQPQWQHVRPRASSSQDVSMPDYKSKKSSSRALTEMSGVSYNRKDFDKQMDDAAIEEIVQALSPEKQNELLKALSPSHGIKGGASAPDNSPNDVTLSAHGATRLSSTTTESTTDRSPATSRTSSKEERMLPFSRTGFGSASSADGIQSMKEKGQAKLRENGSPNISNNLNSFDPAGKSRSALLETAETNRKRSNSSGSKRKRSNPKLDRVNSAGQSPDTKNGGSLQDSIFSPYHVVDSQDGGVGLD